MYIKYAHGARRRNSHAIERNRSMGVKHQKNCQSRAPVSLPCASIPYPMFKYKGTVATCAHAFASKGKCCWCRPVVPTTYHPTRRLLKRVGKVLMISKLCSLMPNSDQFHISNSAQFKTRIGDAESQAPPVSELVTSLIICSMR